MAESGKTNSSDDDLPTSDKKKGIVRSSIVYGNYSSLSDKERYCKVLADSPNENSQVPRVIRDGKVAVIFQPNYFGGWYFEHKNKALLFDPEIVAMIERDAPPLEIFNYCKTLDVSDSEEYRKKMSKGKGIKKPKYDEAFHRRISIISVDNCRGLAFRWVPVSSEFRIHEYDGSETVVLKSEDEWITA